MKSRSLYLLALGLGLLTSGRSLLADNPLIMNQFTADPTARNFNGKIYLYPSHDMKTTPGTWFSMEDYHVFSSENLIDWKDHGVILDQKQVPWVRGAANSMWAPDCVERDGKFYFFFPASNQIGVAIADKPEGPFTLSPTPIVGGIDPCCFIDTASAAKKEDKKPDCYLVWKGNPLSIHKLTDDMKSLDPSTQTVNVPLGNVPAAGRAGAMAPVDGDPLFFTAAPAGPPAAGPGAPGAGGRGGRGGRGGGGRAGGGGGGGAGGLIEGPFMFERKGIYYLTYPHAVNTAGWQSEDLEYATGPSPTGPFTVKGIIMDQTANHCWTNHHSLVEYQGQWILFYHDKDLAPDNDRNRSVRADYVTFADDGSINKVVPTERGVGIRDAKEKIQIDRYSDKSKEGIAIDFINKDKTFDGWKTTFSDKGAWIEYDRVDFAKGGEGAVNVRAMSSTGGTIEIHADKADGPLLARVTIDKGDDWKTANAKVANVPNGVHNLVVTMPEKNDVQIDWVSFE